MMKIENVDVVGWEPAIRGMRNPLESWDKIDSGFRCEIDDGPCNILCEDYGYCRSIDKSEYRVGPNDLDLMKRLAKAGTDHRKYLRMIAVYLDITAPFYFWKEFSTYKVGTVANSCSTMHKIHAKEFTLEDFSYEHLLAYDSELDDYLDECVGTKVYLDAVNPGHLMNITIGTLNYYRMKFLETKDKKYWWQMIKLLPTSYNQKRTVMLNYEVLANMYCSRKNHKLDEWREFCKWVESLPYSELITGERE